MTIQFYRLFFIAVILLCSSVVYSQKNYPINYLHTGILTAPCNVLNAATPYKVGGFEHFPASGGVTTNDTALKLSSYTSGATSYGTAYAIKFPFKKGYTYNISVQASKKSTDPVAAPLIQLGWFNDLGNPNNTHPTDCGAVSQNVFSYWQQNIIGQAFISSTSSANYGFNNLTAPVAQTYLVILVYGGSTSTVTTSIYSINITENIVLNVSSSAGSIACGATTPVTFTVNNPNAAAGITGYTWNLGATPNGWKLPNGNAAPPTYSTGTINTLTLTPVCGAALKGVSATAAANGNTYNTGNSVTVATTQPTLAISGLKTLCSGYTPYTITGLVCNSAIAWTPPPSNVASLSSLTTSPTTMTYGGTRGDFTLTANVTSCGVAQPVTLPVHAGPYISTDYVLNGNNGSNYWCPNQTLSFTVSTSAGVVGGGATNYVWTVPTGWTTVYNGNTNYIQIKSPSSSNPPTGTLSVTFTEPCGSTITKNFFLAYNSSGCGSVSPYTVSPNPASSTITIACASLQTYCNIAQVQITDIYGSVKSSQSWPYTNQQVQMSVSFLPNGTYIARTFDGTNWYSNTFMVQH